MKIKKVVQFSIVVDCKPKISVTLFFQYDFIEFLFNLKLFNQMINKRCFAKLMNFIILFQNAKG